MEISRIFAHRVELPLREGSYKWSGGKSVSVFDSTIVGVETACGLVGYGEVCPLGPFYLPAYAEGVRAGLRELAPHLIGYDPRELSKLNQRMDAALKGHPYVKSGIDIACWDILGKAANLPVCTLLGGRFGDRVRLYRAISQQPPDEMAQNVASYRAQGYTRFQLKVGGDPDQDIERICAARSVLDATDRLVADANTGWTQHEAMRVVRAVRDVDVYIEQPCLNYEECLAVRRHTDHPFVLDENIDSLEMLLRAKGDLAMDVVNLKISKLGGLTKTKQLRDLCISLGIAMTLEDSWGGDITTAAIAHLAHSTPAAREWVHERRDRAGPRCDSPERRDRSAGCRGRWLIAPLRDHHAIERTKVQGLLRFGLRKRSEAATANWPVSTYRGQGVNRFVLAC